MKIALIFQHKTVGVELVFPSNDLTNQKVKCKTTIYPGCFVVDRMIKQPTVLLKKQFSYRFSICLHDLVRMIQNDSEW